MKNKKFLFAMIATAGLLASCSSSDESVADSNVQPPTDDREAISFRMGSLHTTRGTGTVGGVQGAADNVWAGQTFQVYMLDKGTLQISKDEDGNALFQGRTLTTPNVLAGVSANVAAKDIVATSNNGLTVTEQIHYYPLKGSFDFWAYRMDGSENSINESTMKSNFTIDGSQDIMVSKATPYGCTQTGSTWTSPTSKTVEEDYIFSTYAARRDVDPVFNFQHLLTRLQFEVTADKDWCNWTADPTDKTITQYNDTAVYIKSIAIQSLSQGDLTVAYMGSAPANLIDWNTSSQAYLNLKQRDTGTNPINMDLVALQKIAPLWNTTTDAAYETRVGEALIVAPQVSYQMVMTLVQQKPDQIITEYYSVAVTFMGTTYYFQGKAEDYQYYQAWLNAGCPTSGGIYDNFAAWVVTGKTAADGIVVKNGQPVIETVLTTKAVEYPQTITLKSPVPEDGFEAGKTYTVKIKLYNVEQMEFHTVLNGWTDGGNVNVDTDM